MLEKYQLKEITKANQELLNESVWIDLVNPTKTEIQLVEQSLGLHLPTVDEMREIELSSRLYKDNDLLFMTATMIAQSESTNPKQDAVTFVLSPKQLVSIRYIEPQAFQLFKLKLNKLPVVNSYSFFTELLDATTDRLADILEMISHELEVSSKSIFNPINAHNINYKHMLQQLGVIGSLNSRIAESLVSFNRLIHFFDQSVNDALNTYDHERLHSLSKDIIALGDHANFLSNKISFLLEATLGMVQIEQNDIIKIFSVAAVIFLPPTLIASIYGMNFIFIPELKWKYGYLVAIALMMFSSWLPFKYFKYRKWL